MLIELDKSGLCFANTPLQCEGMAMLEGNQPSPYGQLLSCVWIQGAALLFTVAGRKWVGRHRNPLDVIEVSPSHHVTNFAVANVAHLSCPRQNRRLRDFRLETSNIALPAFLFSVLELRTAFL